MIWVCVSNLFDKKKVARDIILAFEEDNFSFPVYLQDSVTLDFLLDDNGDWEDLQAVLKHGKPGSKILVTTRKVSVANTLSCNSGLIYYLSSLPDEDCWLILKQFAFVGKDQLSKQNREPLECIAKRISKKSKGLPLVAKDLGHHLQKSEARLWNDINDKELCNLAVWERVVRSLFLSYHDLPRSRIRDCFLYCVTFPKGLQIRRDNLIRHWIGQGYLAPSGNVKREDEVEATGREFFQHLASCSLFQDFVEEDGAGIVACKMHDIIHDLVQYLTSKDFVMKEVNGSESIEFQLPSNDARHLTVILEEKLYFPVSIKGGSKLRSLSIFSAFGTGGVTCDLLRLFVQSPCLRVLDLGMNNSCDNLLPKISSKIVVLKNYRMADKTKLQSKTHLKKIKIYLDGRIDHAVADTILNLPLSMRNGFFNDHECRLEKLPDGMENLINLRYHCKNGLR
ncbi:hypothetical protein J1N35_023781 [Gossypium stocksii]|uniref:NB-ARC domain-containing protein n=1 Tax=Gossypium stocksii TaxID=47602 RepID=A0A9D3VIP8_9ROSI|nr:hypothetical protein J1N35_023781 [Gossypium stocksii]